MYLSNRVIKIIYITIIIYQKCEVWYFIMYFIALQNWNKCYHIDQNDSMASNTVYPKKYAHGFCFAVLFCGYTLTDFPISIRLTSLALWQSNDCPSASRATLMNMDKYFMWIHYERLHNHNKAKHNKTLCIFLGIYCILIKTGLGQMTAPRILSKVFPLPCKYLNYLGPLLLTWFNFNPSMDKQLHAW